MKTTCVVGILILALLAGSVLITGCQSKDQQPEHEQASPPPKPPKVTSTVPTLTGIANATYEGIYDDPVTLSDGRYEGDPFVAGAASRPVVEWIEEMVAFGDLTGDGVDDAAVLLVENSGGSGTNIYIAAVSQHGGETTNHGTTRVGDRVQVRAIEVANGRAWIDVVEHGPSDAACCPTQLARKSWMLHGGAFEAATSETEGTLSLAVLNGTAWVLSHFSMDEPVPEQAKPSVVFNEGKIGGSGGCNQFSASIVETAPGTITIGPIVSTRKTCPDPIDQIEFRYLGHLENVKEYRFLMGRLALTWQANGKTGTLVFAPRVEED